MEIPKTATVYRYKVIKGEHKGKIVESFDSIYFDPYFCVVPCENMPIATFDDEYEYIMFVEELELIDSYMFDVSSYMEKRNVED